MIKLALGSIPDEVGNWQWPTHNPAFNDLPSFANSVFQWIFGFAGAVAVLAVVYSGIMLITSGGNSEQADKAKKNLTWAIIGAVIISFSSAIVWWTNNVLNNAAP